MKYKETHVHTPACKNKYRNLRRTLRLHSHPWNTVPSIPFWLTREMLTIIAIFLLFPFNALAIPIDEENLFNPEDYVEPEYLDQLLAEKRYDEYNKLMGIEISHLSHPRDENCTNDPMLNEGLLFGDILLTPQQKEEERQGLQFKMRPNMKWGRSIPFSISESYGAADKSKISRAVETWNAEVGTCISFKPRNTEKEYVYFSPSNGCYSYVGKIGKPQIISLAPRGCMSMGTMLHEMMHATGFTHEQNRPDRDGYIRVIWPNIPKEWQSQYRKEDPRNFGIQGKYDYYSVMHYPVNAPGTRLPAFEVLKPGINIRQIGQRNGFTTTDKEKIKTLYECKR